MEKEFLNKKCKLVLNTDFVLYGIVIEITNYGIVFRTTQKTSFIAHSNIKELSLDERGDY